MQWIIFAEGTGGISGWASVAGSIVNVGFSVVVGWYLITKAMPKSQDDFIKALDSQRTNHKLDDKERREDHKDALTLVIAHCERETMLLKGEMGEVTKVMQDNRETMEEVRDELREVKDAVREFRETIKEFLRDRRGSAT